MCATFMSLENQGTAILSSQHKQYELDTTCKVTLNGKDVTVADLMPGDQLEIEGQPAVSIKATRG